MCEVQQFHVLEPGVAGRAPASEKRYDDRSSAQPAGIDPAAVDLFKPGNMRDARGIERHRICGERRHRSQKQAGERRQPCKRRHIS